MKILDLLLTIIEIGYNIFSSVYMFIAGFRLSDWELSQIILSDIRSFQMETSMLYANQIFSHAYFIGLFHFRRGLTYVCKRDPSVTKDVLKAMEILVKSSPVGLNERNTLAYFYMVDQFKTFYKFLPASSSDFKILN